MSSFDMEPVDEAQFESFLLGKDEISQLLRSMPQPKASREVDAAILAMVAADLPAPAAKIDVGQEVKQAIRPTAANQSSFLQRWRAPLGLAASAALVFPMLLLWQNDWQYTEKSATVAEVNQKKIGEEKAYARSTTPATEPIMAERAESAPAASPAADAPAVVAEGLAPPPVAAKPAVALELRKEQAELASNSVKQDGSKKDLQDSAAEAALEKSRAAQSVAVQRAEQEARQIADAKQQAQGQALNKAKSAQIESAGSVYARKQAAEAPLVAAAPAPVAAPMMAAPAAELSAPSAAPARAAAPAPQSVDVTASTVVKSAAQPKAWLSLVEELLKANMQQEALEEWLKFRKAYPQYPVERRLEEKIKALQQK